jgi:hypothetical protein
MKLIAVHFSSFPFHSVFTSNCYAKHFILCSFTSVRDHIFQYIKRRWMIMMKFEFALQWFNITRTGVYSIDIGTDKLPALLLLYTDLVQDFPCDCSL